MNTILIETKTEQQLNIFKAMAKELQLRAQVQNIEEDVFLLELKQAGFEALQIANGEKKAKSIDTLFAELW